MREKAVSGGLKIGWVSYPRSNRISPIHGDASNRAAAAQRARAPIRPARGSGARREQTNAAAYSRLW